MTKNAIIFSKNEKIYKLIKNELLLADFKVKAADASQTDLDGLFDVIVIDASSFELSSVPFVRSFLSRNTEAVKICISDEDSPKSLWGFNNYLHIPFRLDELRSAIFATRQSENQSDGEEKSVSSKCFFADKDGRGVTLDGTYIPLSPNEFNTLRLLCSNAGKCVSREDIMKMMNSSDGNISDVYISHLRNKLELPSGHKIIYTVRLKGYMTDYTISEYLP